MTRNDRNFTAFYILPTKKEKARQEAERRKEQQHLMKAIAKMACLAASAAL